MKVLNFDRGVRIRLPEDPNIIKKRNAPKFDWRKLKLQKPTITVDSILENH